MGPIFGVTQQFAPARLPWGYTQGVSRHLKLPLHTETHKAIRFVFIPWVQVLNKECTR